MKSLRVNASVLTDKKLILRGVTLEVRETPDD
jgi:hypothetical protein